MNPKDFGYSLKNIPIPHKISYTKALVEKTESFLKRMRWKAHFYLTKTDDVNTTNRESLKNFNLKSDNTPPQIAELTSFENDMYDLIQNIKYWSQRNDFKLNSRKILQTLKCQKNCSSQQIKQITFIT